MNLHQSTSLWLWLLGFLLLWYEWHDPFPPFVLLLFALGYILLIIIAHWLVELDPVIAKYIIPIIIGLACLIILI